MKRYFLCIVLISLTVLGGCGHVQSAKSALKQQEPVLIIDPGHGGADGGAVAADGSEESELNLAISLKIEALCAFLGVDTIMTRRAEELDYPESADTIRTKKIADQKARIELINSTPNGVLISIHQNTYPSASPEGAQALYSKTAGSEELAALIQANIAACLGADKDRGTAKISDSIYLMKKAECTAVLVECGFLSNPDELLLLKDETYQNKLAALITAAYTQFISETGNSYG